MSTQLWDHFSATIHLDISEPQPRHGLIQLNAHRDASSELISCDIKREDLIAALEVECGLVIIDPREYSADIMANLITAVDAAGHVTLAESLRGQTRSPEPEALGSLIEDRNGILYTRVVDKSTASGVVRWLRLDRPDHFHTWLSIDSPRLVREGRS